MPETQLRQPLSHRLAMTWIALTIAAMAALFLDRDLVNSLETGYAMTVQAATRDGSWVVPYQNGVPRVVKPPLPFWMGALACEAFGADDAPLPVLRAVSALMGIASAFAVYALGLYLFDRRAALWAGLMWATSYVSVYEYRYARHDIYLTAAVALTMLGAWLWIRQRRGGWALTLLGQVLAFQCKGPVSWGLTVLPVVAYVLLFERERRRVLLGLLGGMLLGALSLGPWLLVMLDAVPGDLRSIYAWEAFGRFNSERASGRPFYFYVEIAAFVLPWLPFFVVGLVGPFRAGTRGERRPLAYALCWLLVGLVFLSLPREKQTRYVVPLLGAAALLMGWAASRAVAWGSSEGRAAWLWRSQWGLLLAGAAAPLVLVGTGWLRLAVGVVLALVTAGLAIEVRRRVRTGALERALVTAFCAAFVLIGTAFEAQETVREPLQPLAEELDGIVGNEPLFSWPDTRPSYALLYYANRSAPILGSALCAVYYLPGTTLDDLNERFEDPERCWPAFRDVLHAYLLAAHGDGLFAFCKPEHVDELTAVAGPLGWSVELALDLTTDSSARDTSRDPLVLLRLSRIAPASHE